LAVSTAPPERGDLPAALLERYQIVALLGRGGMGVVYRAHDQRLRRDVALKILSGLGEDGGRRVLREARAQARIDHENVCQVFEAGVDGDVCHIAMQYVDGAPLGVAGKRMTLVEKVRVVAQVARALDEAHRVGLVHGDVKPSNIMVKQGEDGGPKPYLVDFGIAREVGERGHTCTGAVVGTPAFMAPEQARGDVHALDRRSDVYALGATLFDVLTGRPPFLATHPSRLIDAVLKDEAPGVRSLCPEVPAELEAIVARCLQKAPERRYASAKALGDDLERFLHGGAPRVGAPAPRSRLLRSPRARRIGVALAGVALLAALAIVALWARARALAAPPPPLARELDADVKEMDRLLSGAFALPLHDVERDKDVVRARLDALEARLPALGPAGEGPVHYALGRGYLALQEPEDALHHLEKAVAAGYAPPGIDHALGLAQGQLYLSGLDEAERLYLDPQRKRARLAKVETKYGAPAHRSLQASLGAPLASPSYVEGLIALYDGKPAAALDRARKVFAAMPRLYQAQKLEGDAHVALASRLGDEPALEHDRKMASYQAAAEAYAAAAQIAASDPQVREAECRLWALVMSAAIAHHDSPRPSHESAKAACERAIAVSSRSARAHLELAIVQLSYASWVATSGSMISASDPPEDPDVVLAEAISLAQKATPGCARDPLACYVLGEAHRSAALRLAERGLDARAEVDLAIAAYDQAIIHGSTFTWAVNGLAQAFALKAETEIARGLDPAASLETSLSHSRRALQLYPGSLDAHRHACAAYLLMAEHLVDTGRDPAPTREPWRAAAVAGKASIPGSPSFFESQAAYQAWLEARYALDAGRDPATALEEGTRIAAEALARAPAEVDPNVVAAHLATTRAIDRLRRGADPTPALDEARACLARVAATRPGDVAQHVHRSRVEIVGLQWAAKEHHLAAESFATARAPLLPLLDRERVDPRLYQALAEIDEIEATWRMDRRANADSAIDAGLAMVAKALALNPHLGRALATQGALLLLRARSARDPRARSDAARDARAALSAAGRASPLLERELRPTLQRAPP
jgi:serine/threonine-protein kinase